MHRRTLLKGVAVGAAATPIVLAAGRQPASAAGGGYDIAVVDQNSNTVRVFNRNAKRWNDDAIRWEFHGDTHWYSSTWGDLSEVKIRRTAGQGLIALVTASGGGVGAVDIKKSGERTDSGDLLWQDDMDDGNPHAIERVPYNGSVFVATAKDPDGADDPPDVGRLTQFSPDRPDHAGDIQKLVKVRSWGFRGAHGVLWDPRGKDGVSDGVLWVLGRGRLQGYKVKGSGSDTDLDKWVEIDVQALGHDLQSDYHARADRRQLMLSDSKNVYRVDIGERRAVAIPKHALAKVKSIARHGRSGEYVWVVAEEGELARYIRFGTTLGEATDKRGWSQAKFYKARIFTPDFE